MDSLLSLNEQLIAARYVKYATLCLQAALRMNFVTRHDKGSELSAKEFAKILDIEPAVCRSFLNVLAALGIVKFGSSGYSVVEQAARLLSEGCANSLAPYLSLGAGAKEVDEFLDFLRNPKHSVPVYSAGTEDCLMDDAKTSLEVARKLASRAKRFAPLLARFVSNAVIVQKNTKVLDLGAGSHFVAKELLSICPHCSVSLADRENALGSITQIASESNFTISQFAAESACNIFAYDFFDAPVADMNQQFDIVILSNVLHDWKREQISKIVSNAILLLKDSGRIIVHEAFLGLKDALWMSTYGIALSHMTAGQGSCYTVDAYDSIFNKLGFKRTGRPEETIDGCFAILYERSK